MSDLKSQFAEILIPYATQIKGFVKQHNDKIIDSVTLGQLYSGMRDVASLVTETSLLDNNEGIRFRKLSITEIYHHITKDSYSSAEPTPEFLFILLLLGRVPTQEEMDSLSQEWHKRSTVPKHVYNVIDALPKSTHPMVQFSTAVSAMETESVFNKAYTDGVPRDTYWEYVYEDAMSILGALPHIVSYIYHHNYSNGDKGNNTDTSLDWAGNFAHMIGDKSADKNSLFKEFFRMYTSIHSDHEGGNASASTAHVVGSTLASPYAAFAGALHSLSGPLHGLASQGALVWVQKLLEHYKNEKTITKEHVEEYIHESLKAGRVIPGYGHAVLRCTDPRFMAQMNFAKKHDMDNDLLQAVWTIYDVAPEILGSIGKIKNPYPNLDAHSGAMLHSFQFQDPNFYTVLFGMSRAIGVMAQQIWSRGSMQPLFRPRSVTSEWVEEQINKKIVNK